MDIFSEIEGVLEYVFFLCFGKLICIMDCFGFVFEEIIIYIEKEFDDGGCINGYIIMEVIGNEMVWIWNGVVFYEVMIVFGMFYCVIDMSLFLIE